MSTINMSFTLSHAETGVTVGSGSTRVTATDGLEVVQVPATTIESSVTATYAYPRNIALRLLSGDDVRVGVVSGVYPFLLSGEDDGMLLSMDCNGQNEVTHFFPEADVAGSLDGSYLELRTEADQKVWIWFRVAAAATGVLTLTGNATNNETVYVGGNNYTFVNTIAPDVHTAGLVKIGATISETLLNLSKAINDSGEGMVPVYGSNTSANYYVSATLGSGDTLVVKSRIGGSLRNTVATTSTLAAGSWGGPTLSGGTDGSSAPTHTTEQLIEVVVMPDASAASVKSSIVNKLSGSPFYLYQHLNGAAGITLADRFPGSRSAATAGTTGWAAPTQVTAGADPPTIFFLSTGVSSLLVASVPQ